MVINKYKNYSVVIAAIFFGLGLVLLAKFNYEFVIIFYSLITLGILMYTGLPKKNGSIVYRKIFTFTVISNLLAWILTLIQWNL